MFGRKECKLEAFYLNLYLNFKNKLLSSSLGIIVRKIKKVDRISDKQPRFLYEFIISFLKRSNRFLLEDSLRFYQTHEISQFEEWLFFEQVSTEDSQ